MSPIEESAALVSLPVNCPHCGQPLRYVARNLQDEFVFTCLRDGWFVFTKDRGLERLKPDGPDETK